MSSCAPACLLLFCGTVCQGLVETCEDLQAAFNLTKTQDVVVEMHPFQDIDCETFTTMGMDSNTLTVKSSEDLDHYHGASDLYEVRFVVTSGAKLIWEINVEFNGPYDGDVNGGGVFVREGSTVHFLNDLEMTRVGVSSVTDGDSDFARYVLSGGCVYTDGYFRVDGEATFTKCDISGGGESPPGPGGVLYVGKGGSALFNGALEMSETYITDDGGGHGGGVYHEGNVLINGNAKFESIRARNGGALYNAAGAQFRFTNQATALFTDCSNRDGVGSALYNGEYFEFSGPALFIEFEAPSIYVAATGETILSENSVFWGTEYGGTASVIVDSEGELDLPTSVSFITTVDVDCTVYYKEDKTCIEPGT